jgi:hypothetical protein
MAVIWIGRLTSHACPNQPHCKILAVHRPVFCDPLEAYTGPVDTSAQATLAPHQTLEQEESAETTFMVMRHVHQLTLRSC